MLTRCSKCALILVATIMTVRVLVVVKTGSLPEISAREMMRV